MNAAYYFTHFNPSSPHLHNNTISHTCLGNDTMTAATDQANEMRTQAFQELQQSIQSYNDTFVLNMRYQEKQQQKARVQGMKKISANYGNDLSSDEDVIEDRKDRRRRLKEDRMMDELTVIFQAGSINDYTPVLEWESKQNMPDHLTYGM